MLDELGPSRKPDIERSGAGRVEKSVTKSGHACNHRRAVDISSITGHLYTGSDWAQYMKKALTTFGFAGFITDEGVRRPAMGVMERTTRAMRMLMRMLW